MMNFRSTRIWRNTLGVRDDDPDASARERLRNAFEHFRERAGLLAAEIARDLPDLTVHDLTHIDSLWLMADTIVGPDVHINAAEAFVLGGAFLLHDTAMTLAAYPDGIAGLQSRPEWNDFVAGALTRRLGRVPTLEELVSAPEEIKRETKFWMLRQFHAQEAELLAGREWQDRSSGERRQLVADTDLLNAYSSIIGKIAHSHWWSASELPSRFPDSRTGAPAFLPSDWTVDALKLALVLRVCDAAHLDSRRAPLFLRMLRNPGAHSAPHWIFQGRVYQPYGEGERLVYTSSPFPLSEASAWWLCFETLAMVDRELRSADELNIETGRMRFAARGVAGAGAPARIAKMIPTLHWTPVDTQVKISKVAELVSKLGGRELYGEDDAVPLRELIQNAADAIRAARILQNRERSWGSIDVVLGKDEHGAWLEIGDNGVGMSEAVLTGPLLDFGVSFWSTPEAISEFPTLLAKGFHAVGRYGIGFFSVFMWADRVKVVTRRYDEAVSATRVLEFSGGLDERPILREARPNERIHDGGTRIRIWPKHIKDTRQKWLKTGSRQAATVARAIRWLCPTLDADVFVSVVDHRRHRLATANDWLAITGKDLLHRANPDSPAFWLDEEGQTVRPLHDRGIVVGKATISPYSSLGGGFVTVGGMRSSTRLPHINGFLAGKSLRAARDEAELLVSPEELTRWATEQATLFAESAASDERKATAARKIWILGANVGTLPIAKIEDRWVNCLELSEWARTRKSVLLLDDQGLKRRYAEEGTFNMGVGRTIYLPDDVVMEPTLLFLSLLQQNRAFDSKSILDHYTTSHSIEIDVRRRVSPAVDTIVSAWSETPSMQSSRMIIDDELVAEGVRISRP